MAKKTRKPRKVYSAKQRADILAAASKEGLTAEAVQKRFGVTPVTITRGEGRREWELADREEDSNSRRASWKAV